MLSVEVRPLQPPFPKGHREIHFVQYDKVLAVSEADFKLMVGLLGVDMENLTIELAPGDREGTIFIRAIEH